MSVRSPLRWSGSYPMLSLWFPELSTAEQKQAGEKGVSLKFLVDTAASVNTINAKVAADLGLVRVGEISAGIGAGGNISGGDTFMLGDCELDDLPAAGRVQFMSGLTASALPIATPAAGIIGAAFLSSFPGGVEFYWGSPPSRSDASITFFGETQSLESAVPTGLCSVPVQMLPETGLPRTILTINGVDIPALLDTGSPITVLNRAAAAVAGIRTSDSDVERDADTESDGSSNNPFANFFAGVEAMFGAARETAALGQRVASGEVVLIGGANGMVQLERSKTAVSFAIGEAKIGESTVLVGDMPGLAALDGLGADAGPAAILGIDVLRQRQRLVCRSGDILL